MLTDFVGGAEQLKWFFVNCGADRKCKHFHTDVPAVLTPPCSQCPLAFTHLQIHVFYGDAPSLSEAHRSWTLWQQGSSFSCNFNLLLKISCLLNETQICVVVIQAYVWGFCLELFSVMHVTVGCSMVVAFNPHQSNSDWDHWTGSRVLPEHPLFFGISLVIQYFRMLLCVDQQVSGWEW